MHGKEEESKQGCSLDLRERNLLEGLEVDGRMLLKRSYRNRRGIREGD